MQNAITLIDTHLRNYPSFEYYVELMEKAEQEVISNPDICIETCKSLIEGIAKQILLLVKPNDLLEELNKQSNAKKLVKRACDRLSISSNLIDDQVISEMANMVETLVQLRNKRGDISHGRTSPKFAESSEQLAQMVLRMTDAALVYLIEAFIDIQKPERIPYDDNVEFNSLLDETFPLDGSQLIYSKALYETRYDDYFTQLQVHIDEQSQEAAE